MKAFAVTGADGKRLVRGFDLSSVFVDSMGDKINHWDREVCYKGTATLRDVLKKDKYLKWDLLANILRKDEKVPLDTELDLFATGKVREIRIKKRQYRIYGELYLGKR